MKFVPGGIFPLAFKKKLLFLGQNTMLTWISLLVAKNETGSYDDPR